MGRADVDPHRGTDAGLRLTIWDDRIRCALIPVLAIAAIVSILTGKPFPTNWYATKVLVDSGLLVIGLILRFVMRHWTTTFRQLAAGGPREELEAKSKREITTARRLACVYWIGIGAVAFIGVSKFFWHLTVFAYLCTLVRFLFTEPD